MSASSSVASSTLLRPRAGVVALVTVAAAYATYSWYFSRNYNGETSAEHGAALHRSNAVYRRRRRNTNPDEEITSASVFVDDQVENDGEGHIVARTLTDGETVVDDQAFQEEYGWANLPQSYQRNGQNTVQLLFRVSEDATRRNAYVHRGCACNSCGVVPIRGVRYRCANCADYDLCESCESQGLHTKTHIFYKIKVPAPSFGPRNIQPVWYSGDPDSVMRVLPKDITTKLSQATGFERPELDAYWEQWTFMANTDWRDDPDDINLAMDRKTFERCLIPSGGYKHAAPSLIFDRMFAFYDTNKDDLIGFPEFLHAIAFRKKKDKWKKIFEGYDIDADGYVDRKDFLRMFRSYYVLYRQMHQDMLEGIEEQQMTSIDAHRLVSSRQPLSSAFGQDGRYPPAPDPRTREGKLAQANGDMEIVDGRGVMNESGNDTGNREDIFRRDVPRAPGSMFDSQIADSAGYWDAVLHPPESMDEIPDVLRNLRSNRVRNIEWVPPEMSHEPLPRRRGDSEVSNAHPALREAQRLDHDDTLGSDDSDDDYMSETDANWPPSFVTITDEDAAAVQGPGTRVDDVERSNRRAVTSVAVYRARAQRDVYERWRRRNFYTDEEDGATPPVDWKEDDDVLAHSGLAGESSKRPSRPIIHSRSSSKVRFAEDMDDFDTRSNPSTSSRSVPERWGGMEIPDSEKDAGKEILYQVTQQSFNELLDPLFKDKEDLALEAAASKHERERYRSWFIQPAFDKWAREEEARELKKAEAGKKRKPSEREAFTTPNWDGTQFSEVEVEQVRERPLEDLLAATGYQVAPSAPEMTEAAAILSSPRHTQEATRSLVSEDLAIHESLDEHPFVLERITSPTEVLSIIAQYDDDDRDPTSSLSASPRATPQASSPESNPSYHDLTFPQFRPNSDAESVTAPPARSPPSTHEKFDPPQLPFFIPPGPASPSPMLGQKASFQKDKPPTSKRLYELWKYDLAALEAEERGGWGRLNFKEFETRVKKFVREGKGNQMDYLGSWIEFCIP